MSNQSSSSAIGETREERRKENVGLYRSFGFCVGLHAEAQNDLLSGTEGVRGIDPCLFGRQKLDYLDFG
jgi:hypothetical protein